MPDKKDDIELIWFEHLKNNEWGLPPEYLKHIQKFETSLILLSVNKNADAVIKIVESLEGISRQSDGMIDNYDYKWSFKAKKISDEIKHICNKITGTKLVKKIGEFYGSHFSAWSSNKFSFGIYSTLSGIA